MKGVLASVWEISYDAIFDEYHISQWQNTTETKNIVIPMLICVIEFWNYGYSFKDWYRKSWEMYIYITKDKDRFNIGSVFHLTDV